MSEYVTLDITGKGHARLSERGECVNRMWNSIGLLDEGIDDIILSIIKDSDTPEGSISFEIRGFHMENQETGRAFHADLQMFLKRRGLERLRAYLDFILGSDIEVAHDGRLPVRGGAE